MEELAEKLKKLMGEPGLRTRLVEAAKKRCLELFTWEKIGNDMHEKILSVRK